MGSGRFSISRQSTNLGNEHTHALTQRRGREGGREQGGENMVTPFLRSWSSVMKGTMTPGISLRRIPHTR
jgi:hypothetical protein